MSNGDITAKMAVFQEKCRQAKLKITPQRLAVYRALILSNEHPSANMVYRQLRRDFPSISLDTVNRTLLTLTEIGAAFVVEGSGNVRRYDGNLENHQHFRCVNCGKVIDFHCERFDDIPIPDDIEEKFVVLRKTVYIEGLCQNCKSELNGKDAVQPNVKIKMKNAK